MKTFTVLPTKQGFGISHLTIDLIGFRELLVRNDIAVPPYRSKWNEVRYIYWRRFFRIDKVETIEFGHLRFTREISTDGKSVNIKIRKPERGPSEPNANDLQAADIGSRWGLDASKCNLLVTTNQDDETVVCSGKEYREDAYITKSSQKQLRWIRDRPDTGAAFASMPTKRSMLLKRWREYVPFMTQHLHLLVTPMQHKSYRRHRLRRSFFKKKKLCELYQKLVCHGERIFIVIDNRSNGDPNGAIKGKPSALVQKLALELSKTSNCTVIIIAEFRISKVHFGYQQELSKQYPYRKAAVHVRAVHERRATYPVYGLLHFRNKGCSGMSVNRDVNASKNMLRLLDCELNETRPVTYTHQANR